jgi:hypothetical protein
MESGGKVNLERLDVLESLRRSRVGGLVLKILANQDRGQQHQL